MKGRTFSDAVASRDSIRALLEGLGIEARCVIALGDAGPRVDVFVLQKDLDRAHKALHPHIQGGTVIVHKAVPPKP